MAHGIGDRVFLRHDVWAMARDTAPSSFKIVISNIMVDSPLPPGGRDLSCCVAEGLGESVGGPPLFQAVNIVG